MMRSYYSEKFSKFLTDSDDVILGTLLRNDPYSTLNTQKSAWKVQIELLKNNLNNLNLDRILFEYTIPRMGRRVDNVLFFKGIVFLIEFKVGEDSFKNQDLKQAEGYALDLKYFQAGSRTCKIVPILVATEAPTTDNSFELVEGIFKPLKSNGENLSELMLNVSEMLDEPELDSINWEQSNYNPTPTIIEACQALYAEHKVEEITRNDREGEAFIQASKTIEKIILDSKNNNHKSLVFLTGIPGSGKTLVGLDVASKFQNIAEDQHSVYVCGTSALIHVIQEALVRDKYHRLKETPDQKTKQAIRKEVEVLFQVILHYRKSVITENAPAYEKIVVFDEAQRMWDQHEADKNIKLLGLPPKKQSEPDLLIEHMDKSHEWGVILCLLGGGQEINKGEDGLIEWLKSIKNNFPHWHVYAAPEIKTKEYLGNSSSDEILDFPHKQFLDELHLRTSTRSFKAEGFSKMINHLLEVEFDESKHIITQLNTKPESEKYHLLLTRDFQTAKNWVKSKTRGTERCGLFTTSKSIRLWPEGIVKRGQREFDPLAWWLDDEKYIDSSISLEIPCTEFFSQGLELDWSIFAWDACLRPKNNDWEYFRFERYTWKKINDEKKQKFLKNAFRVLLTRARQGTIIFVPKGDTEDNTRLPEYYDGIYNYLKQLGIQEI